MKEKFEDLMRLDGLSLTLYLLLRFSIFSTMAIFVIVIGFICLKGVGHLNLGLFEWEFNSENVSMMPAIINTLTMVLFSLILAVPLGIFGAVFLNEYSKSTNKIVAVISVAAETLVGIPSIVYGLFGYLAFVVYFKMGQCLMAGILTLSVMILPLVLRSGQEALKAVPMSFREASFALGAGKLRTIFAIIVPAALPGILAGIILSIGKIVGESAALLYTSGAVPQVAGLGDSGATLSVHMYTISSEGLHIDEAYSTAMMLIIIVLIINTCANLIAKKLTKA